MTTPAPNRLRVALIIGAVSVLSAAAYAFLHFGDPSGLGYPTASGVCERIRESGIPAHPGDWFCSTPEWHSRANTMLSELLIAVGFAFPAAILAATGRRLTAALPLIPALFLAHPLLNTGSGLYWWQAEARWFDNDLLVTLGKLVVGPTVSLVVLAAPAVAVWLAAGRRVPARSRERDSYRLLAAAACVPAGVAVILLTPKILAGHFEEPGVLAELWSFRTVAPFAAAIGIFGALLGPDRRWWPWSLAVSAFFLSEGPSSLYFFEFSPEGLAFWTMFGLVVPLFLIGLIGSGWKGVAVWITRRISDQSPEATDAGSSGFRVGATIALNGLAAALIGVSVLLFVMDPVPRRFYISLPTYLEPREQALDVRARMNLDSAMDAMISYRTRKGTFEGFDAKVGRRAEGELLWHDGFPRLKDEQGTTPGPEFPILEVSIVTASREAQVATLSRQDKAFCLERSPSGKIRYGESEEGTRGLGALRSADSNCGTMPWTPEAVEPPPLPKCVARTPGFLICRMVQVQMFSVLKNPGP